MPQPDRASSPYEFMASLAGRGVDFAVATVVRTQGSTPQVVGAKIVVTGDEAERPVGTLGGGCVEADAILSARQVLREGGRLLHVHQLNEELAWNTGLVCGGTMWILAERRELALEAGGYDALPDALAATRGAPPIAFVTRFSRGERRAFEFDGRTIVLAGGRMFGSFGDPLVDERAREAALEQMHLGTTRLVPVDDVHDLLVEPVASRPRPGRGGRRARRQGHRAAGPAPRLRRHDSRRPA